MLEVQGGRYVRMLDGSGRAQQGVIENESFAGTGMPQPGPRATQLPATGFVSAQPGGDLAYYIPMPAVLLSPGFSRTHCIDRILLERARPDQFALGIRPVEGSNVSGIEAKLWLDRSSAAPRTLEFEFAIALACCRPVHMA